MKIADVRCFKVTGPAAPSLIEERQIGMLDIYPEYAGRTVTRRSPESRHVEDDHQWPDDTSPDEYLASLRETVLATHGGLFLAEAEIERTWTIYFVGPVRYRWRGRYPGRLIVVLFNAERLFWITGFQAERGADYVDRQDGFWVRDPA